MSYNSEVCLLLNKKATDAFYRRIDQLSLYDKNLIWEFLGECYTKHVDNNFVLFYWKNYRWLLTNTGVLFIETFIKDTPETWYKYIRLGDEERDTEVQGYYSTEKVNIHLVREISFSLGEEND